MSILPEQGGAGEQSLYEQIANIHIALHLLSDGPVEVQPAEPQPKPEIADPNEGLDGPYGVNVD